MRNRVCWIMSVACLTIFCLVGSLGAVVYRYQDLSLQGLTFSAAKPKSITAINDSAWIVGNDYNYSGSSNYQPFVWRPGLGRTNLQGRAASAYGINNQGQIVGQADTFPGPLKACYWSDPSAVPVGLYTSFESMVGGCAYGINEAGQVAGEGSFVIVGPTHAALWPANHSTGTDLNTLGGPASSGIGINNAGWVVGTAWPADGNTQACLWVPGQQQPQQIPLPSTPFTSVAYVITDHGTVLGSAFLGTGGQAFFYDNQTGEAQYIVPGAYNSSASGMSEADQVVGWYEIMVPNYSSGVYYWTPDGGKKDLNKMVVNLPQGVTLSSVAAISRNGKYITGFDSQGHAYLLSPIAAPAGINLLLLY